MTFSCGALTNNCSSTGGIIALGLGNSGWSVSQCRDTFIKLCGRAFTPRDFHGIPFFRNFAFLHHHSFYKTRPFEHALQEAFGSRYLFQSGRGYGSPRTRVAVTSATASGDKAVVIANYNRHCGSEEGERKREYMWDYNFADAGRLHLRKTRACRSRDGGLARSTGNVCGAQIL